MEEILFVTPTDGEGVKFHEANGWSSSTVVNALFARPALLPVQNRSRTQGSGCGPGRRGIPAPLHDAMGDTRRVGRNENSGRLARGPLSRPRALTAHAIEKSTATIVNPSRSATRCEAMFSHDVL